MAALGVRGDPGALLALTGRRDFWPLDRPFWLVSPACVPNGPTSSAAPAGIVPFPWAPGDMPAVHAESRAMFDRLLGFLAGRLNAVHGVSYGRTYWNIVIGPWLFHYINLLVHHARSLQAARRQLGDLEAIGLHEQAFVTPSSALDFIYEATDDLYNLQLYTRLCDVTGIPLIERRAPATEDRIATRHNPENLVKRRLPIVDRMTASLRYRMVRALQGLLAPRVRVLMRRSYLPPAFEWDLIKRSRGRVWSHMNGDFQLPRDTALDEGMRDALHGFDDGGPLGSYLRSFVSRDIPQVFVEAYADLVRYSDAAYGRYAPCTVLSTVAWHTDQAFGHFAGSRAESGTRLVGGQHGGIEGVEANSQIEQFERTLTSEYLTWGWSDPADNRCIPTPATRLVEVKERPRPLQGSGILYGGTVATRFPMIARPDFSGYFELQRRFFAELVPELRAQFRIRLHTTDYGWGIERRLRTTFPDLTFERWDRSFKASLLSTRLYVCDHLSTTFVEAMATNSPAVLFWDPVFTGIRPAAQPVFDLCRVAGIVHDSPEDAARWAARVYHDVDAWWMQSETQRAVVAFRYHFARTTADPVGDWRTLLNRLAADC